MMGRRRSQCKCICHQPGIKAIHVMPCCTPDDSDPKDDLEAEEQMEGEYFQAPETNSDT